MNQQRLRVPCLRHTIKPEKPSPSPRHNRLRYPKSLASLWFQPRGYARESYLRSGYVMGGLTGWWLEPGSWKAACYQTQSNPMLGQASQFSVSGPALGGVCRCQICFSHWHRLRQHQVPSLLRACRHSSCQLLLCIIALSFLTLFRYDSCF
jgi:hypothetical protein